MDEQKNNLENNNPENLDYSFDFANQVEPEVQSQETVAVEPAPAEPQMVDVSVPVMDQPVQAQVQEPAPAEPQMVDVSVPVMDQPVQAQVQEPAPAEPQMVDVSVPVTDQPVQVQETVTVEQTQQPAETTEELKDSKSTLRFVIILAVIIVAFIIALPFVLNLLGY